MSVFIEASNNNLNFFLENPIFLDVQDEEGNSLLHYAIRAGAISVSLYLLENHINPNIINYRKETAIFEAVRKGNKEIIVKIINNFGEVNLANINGETPLHLAILKGNIDVIKLLLENKADIKALNAFGESILFYAIRSGNLNNFKELNKLSPQLKKVCKSKNSLLHLAASLGNVKIIKYLLTLNENPHLKNTFGETPLFISVKEGLIDLVGILIKTGSYIDVLNKYNESLFDLKSVKEDKTIEETLLFYKESSINTKNIKKHPLRHAVITKNIHLLEKLINNGEKDFKDEYNLSAYDYAKLEKSKQMLLIMEKK